MAADPAAIRRWAAAHAATVLAPGARPAAAPPAATPAVLSSFREINVLNAGHWINAVAWAHHPDGRVLLAAAGSSQNAITVWDYATAGRLPTLPWTDHDWPAPDGSVSISDIAWGYEPDGAPLLAAAAHDNRRRAVRVWSLDSGDVRLTHVLPEEHASIVEAASGSVTWGRQSDGRSLLAFSAQQSGGRTWTWDPGTTAAARILGRQSGRAVSATWGQREDGQGFLATGDSDGTIRVLNPDGGQVVETFTDHRGEVDQIAWVRRADGQALLATASVIKDGVRVWAAAEDRFAQVPVELGAPEAGRTLAIAWGQTDDGRLLLAASSAESLGGTRRDRQLHLWDGQTMRHLHTERLPHGTAGFRHLDWTVTPAGGLLLAVGSPDQKVRIWEAVLDPPVRPPGETVETGAREGVNVGGRGAAKRGKIVDPPEDVTPQFAGDESLYDAQSVQCTVRDDGHVLAATTNDRGSAVQIWDATTGARLHALAGSAPKLGQLAWGKRPDNGPVLATTADNESTVQIWDGGGGGLIASYPDLHSGGSRSVGWLHGPDGRVLLASGGFSDGTAHIRDPETGQILVSLTGHESIVRTVTEGWLADGQHRLVTTASRRPGRMWDPQTGELIGELIESPGSTDDSTHAAAWGHGPDGRPEIAVSTTDGRISIWDPETSEVRRTLTGHNGIVASLAWADQPGWPSILVSASEDRTTRIWDAHEGTELHRLPNASGSRGSIDLIRDPDGDLLLFIAARQRPGRLVTGPFTVWRIASGLANDARPGASTLEPLTASEANELTGWLLRLGGGGLWPPLGLVCDLVTLTGPADQAGRSRLAALAPEPGITRLRALGWAAPARVAFAALLTSGIESPRRFVPPDGAGSVPASPAQLREALRPALAGVVTADDSADGAPRAVPLAGLRAAAARVTEQTVTLLRLLGPEACAADPVLPLRLVHYAARLPALTPREVKLLAEAGGRRADGHRAAAAGTLAYSPGTAGLARGGPLTRLLPSQLALPRDLLTIRLAGDQLLYRQHRTPARPAPEPVTIVLDTTPPTFGPAGQALRLAAHLIATTLWDHGRHPRLITLTDPGTVTELRAPADLVRLWASGTLDDPVPALATAMAAAGASAQPTLFCTHHHTARGRYTPARLTRLLTSHQPPEQPARPPDGPWHAHLAPNPTRAQLASAITRLLIPLAEDGG